MSERTRRVPVVSAGRANAKNALEALKAAREGGAKRVAGFELKTEQAVYDVLEEEDYVKLVAKRRDEGGDFIVNDDGQGYADLGEEDDHWRAKGDGSGEDGESDQEEAAGGKKRKGDGKGDGKAKKKGPGAGASDPGAGSGDIAKMFSKAAARAALNARPAAREVAVEGSDALLADILGGMGDMGDMGSAGSMGGVPLARVSAVPRPSVLGRAAPAVPKAPIAGMGRPMPAAGQSMAMRPLTNGAAPQQPMPRSTAPTARTSIGNSSGATLSAHGRPQTPVTMELKDEHESGLDDHMADHMEVDEYGLHVEEPACEVEHAPDFKSTGATDTSQAPAATAAAPSPTPATAAKPAPVRPAGVGAVVQERSQAAATGWASMYADELQEGEEKGDVKQEQPSSVGSMGQAGEAGQSGACGPAPCTLADGSTPFYFLDAYENADARAGEVFLFGKVPLEAPSGPSSHGAVPQWASACVIVRNCQRSVLVVPRSEVFADADGTIAHLEASAAAAAKEAAQQKAEAARCDAEATRASAQATQPTSTGSAANAPSAEDQAARHEAATAAAAAAREKEGDANARAAAARLELIKVLQGRCGELKAELREVLASAGVKSFRMVPVKRAYAFENEQVPRGEQWCIKIRYPASEPLLSPTLTGQHFTALFGAAVPCLESLLVKRKLKGPCWTVLQGAQRIEYCNQVSWCKVELSLASPKSLVCDPTHPDVCSRAAPPVTVASLNLKTVINPGTQQHEIVAAAVVNLVDFVDLEAPMAQDQWNKQQVLRNFCVLRKLDGHAWPPGFEAAAAAENRGPRGRLNGGNMLLLQPSERSLLTTLLAKMQALDADVVVGHNISAFDLHVLLTRMQHHKVPLWSRIGRLKRSSWPRMTGGGHAYGGGASQGTLTALAGRVICDTYLSARELVREVDFTLRTLSASLLGQERGDLTSADISRNYTTTQGLLDLVRHAEGDAWLSLGLMFHLSILPLTRALTALSGSLWTKTLQGARAQRIEMLLLHEFHARKFILPDKVGFKDASSGASTGAKGKATSTKKRKADGKGTASAGADAANGGGEEDMVMMDMDDMPEEEGAPKSGVAAKGGKAGKPQYLGGLVLEPKKGLYDRLVIMLDFNSLYPSIIQEFNICFSTVTRPTDGSMPPLPAGPAPGAGLAPLPTILQGLVQRRRQAKSAMANARDPIVKQQLNIRQQALKLTANSMYGCLGFTSSRFYAKPLAELITSQGRSILQATVDLVQGTLGAEVIYGDTDSIMINTGSTDLSVARELGTRIKKEVNKRYKLLEIELDAIFRCMLLLKKKKYAAIKLEPGPGNSVVEVQEQKGLDIVRRDWCALSKDAGHRVLSAVLSCRPCEEVVADIHEHLREVREAVMSGTVSLQKFVITKQLTKRIEEYTDARSQPHVQVAMRRRAAGKRDGTMPGEAVPYVICIERPKETQGAGNQAPIGTPHPDAPCSNGHHAAGAATHAQQGETSAAAAQHQNGGQLPHTPLPATHGAGASSMGPTPGRSTAGMASVGVTGMATPATTGKSASGGSGGLAERAYHPEELVESGGRLMLDTEYYLGQQVHPVVSRLVAVLQGTDAARLAECLGLDATRYRQQGGQGSGYQGGEADADMFGGSALDDEALYQSCEPLTLTAPGPERSRFEFRGALEVAAGRMSAEQLLSPPEAVGDPQRTLQGAQLANQVVLRAREVVSRYYDGWLDADDELAQAAHDASNNAAPGSNGYRDVVLRPCGEMDRCPHPDASGHGGVLMARRMSERQLYLQLCHYHRLLSPELAVKRGMAQIKAKDPKSAVTEAELRARLAPVAPALRAACDALEKLRSQSAYHWVDLTLLLQPLRQAAAGRSSMPSAAVPHVTPVA